MCDLFQWKCPEERRCEPKSEGTELMKSSQARPGTYLPGHRFGKQTIGSLPNQQVTSARNGTQTLSPLFVEACPGCFWSCGVVHSTKTVAIQPLRSWRDFKAHTIPAHVQHWSAPCFQLVVVYESISNSANTAAVYL